MLKTFSTRHVRRYIEKNEETTMEEKVKQKNVMVHLCGGDYKSDDNDVGNVNGGASSSG